MANGVNRSTSLFRRRNTSSAPSIGSSSTRLPGRPCRTTPATALKSTTAGKLSSAIAVNTLNGRSLSSKLTGAGVSRMAGWKNDDAVIGGSQVGTSSTADPAASTRHANTRPPVRRRVRSDVLLSSPSEHASSNMMNGIVTNCDARMNIVPTMPHVEQYSGTTHAARMPNASARRLRTPNGRSARRCRIAVRRCRCCMQLSDDHNGYATGNTKLVGNDNGVVSGSNTRRFK